MSQELEAIKALEGIVKDVGVKSGADFDKLQGEFKERYERIDADLKVSDAKNAELVASVVAEQKKANDLEERFNELELKASRTQKGSNGRQISQEVKTFEKFLQKGLHGISADEVKTLNTNVDTEGAVLVPDEMSQEIIKNITEVSPIRQVSRVRQTTAMQYRQPRRDNNLTAAWAGELATRGATQQVYGEDIINVNSLTAIVPLSNQILTSAAFNMEMEVNADAAEQFAQAEGTAFVSGDGNNKPKGFLTEALGGITSGTNDTIDGDDLINLAGELKTGYNPLYAMNRRTLAFIRTLTGSDGQYLWGSGLAAGKPNTINGYAYIEAEDMPDIADGTIPVAFGDFARGFLIVDKLGMTAIRDPYTRKNEGIVEFSFEKAVGGKVILKEALKLLTVQ